MHARSCRSVVLLASIYIGSCTTAFAQSTALVQGFVVAAADHSPVANATITLPLAGEPRKTVADAAGRFVFAQVPPGEYEVSAAAEGFGSRTVKIGVKPRDALSITLQLEVSRLAVTVDVGASLPTVPSTHSPGSTLLKAARLESLPLAQRTHLPDAIVTATPGMIRGHDDFVHIRGHEVALNPSIDGVQFWENAHAVFSPGLGVEYIESINVMTGGFPAEYGNRFGGILDVVTKSGRTLGNRGSVSLGVGTARRNNLGVEFGGRTERTALYLNLTGFMSDRFLSPPSPRSIHNSGRGLRGFGRVDVRASDRDQLKLMMLGDGTNFELPMEERDLLLRPGFRNAQRARSETLLLSWERVQSPRALVQATLYQRWSSVRQYPESTDPYGAQTTAERALATLGVKSDATRLFGRHTVKGGLDLGLLRPREDVSYLSQPWIDFTHLPAVNESHVHFRGPNAGPGTPRPVVFSGAKTGEQVSAFVQDKAQLTSALTLDVGVRFDRYRLAISESHLSPRVNAAYRFPRGTTVFGSYNHFFVPPPIENVLASSAGLTALVSEIGRPLNAVRALTEDQFEVGVTQPLAHSATVSITSYYRRSDDPPHTSLFPDSRLYAYASFDAGTAYGVEAKLDLPRVPAAPGVSGYLNYALGRVWFENPIVAGFTTEAAHITETGRFLAPMDQTHTLASGLTYQHTRTRLWGSVGLEYGSGTPGGHGGGDHAHAGGESHEHASGPGLCGTRCPSHVTHNLSAGWNARADGPRPWFTLQVNVENVSNRVYLISRESTMVQGQYSNPRLVSVSVRVRF